LPYWTVKIVLRENPYAHRNPAGFSEAILLNMLTSLVSDTYTRSWFISGAMEIATSKQWSVCMKEPIRTMQPHVGAKQRPQVFLGKRFLFHSVR